jgi:hypothetical protein
MDWIGCPGYLQKIASRFAGDFLFKESCPGSTKYHEKHDYAALREPSRKHPSGVFGYEKHLLSYQNNSGEKCETVLHTTTLQATKCKSIDLAHNNHLIYFLGANSVFEYKIDDIKMFARTGLTVHIANYPAVKNCFADLVWQGYYTVLHVLERYKIRPDQIILIGDSFGGAVAEYVFMSFYRKNIILGGRIVSNSFNDFRTALDDFTHNDPSGFCANMITYGLVKPLILKSWNANPLASTNICPSLLFMSNREGDRTLMQSQLTAHATNQCGFFDHNLAEKYHLKKDGITQLFYPPPDPLPSSTLQRILEATRVLAHHTRLKMRHDLSTSRVDEIKGNAHDILYSECDPIRARNLPRGHKEPSRPNEEDGCVSGPHNTTEMIEAFLTLSLFHHAQIKVKRAMQSLGWKIATRIRHKQKSPSL